jgi:hypothetical protein
MNPSMPSANAPYCSAHARDYHLQFKRKVRLQNRQDRAHQEEACDRTSENALEHQEKRRRADRSMMRTLMGGEARHNVPAYVSDPSGHYLCSQVNTELAR